MILRFRGQPLNAEEVGPKAANLAAMACAGLPVPPFFVLPASTLDELLRSFGHGPLLQRLGDGLARGEVPAQLAANVREAIARCEPPEALNAELLRAASPLLQGGALAVRSSAAREDGARSWAGQHRSVLNVGQAGLWPAIRAVWGSAYEPRALAYRGAGPSPAMAVLVQRLVLPSASGVAFTADPVSGDRGVVVVEAGPGLGERLVEGRALADCYRLGVDGGIRERSVPRKVSRLVPLPLASGELVEQPLPWDEQQRPCLTDEQVAAVASLARSAEACLGQPVDVEWAWGDQLHLLQARPITTLGRAREEAARRRPPLWTQRFAGERWPGLATPMGWSLVQPVLHQFIRWPEASRRYLEGTEPTLLHRGRPYFNITIFRHLAFRLPGGAPPQFLLEMFPEEEQRALRAAAPPDIGAVRAVLGEVWRERRWRRYRWNPLGNRAVWHAFEPRLRAEVAALPTVFCEATEGLRALGRARELMVEYMSIHLLSLLFAHLGFEAVERALAAWAGESGPAVRSALLADVGGNPTLRTNAALWSLARRALLHPPIEAALRAGERRPAELSRLPGGGPFVAELRGAMREFGHRSTASYEVFAPRWVDRPDLLLDGITSMLSQGVDPEQRRRRREQERDATERRVRQRLRRRALSELAPWRAGAFSWLLRWTRGYLALREEQRFAFDRLMLRTQQILLGLGKLLVMQGALADAGDVAMLSVEELERALAGPADWGERVARRRARQQAWALEPAPDFLEGVPPDLRPLGSTPGPRDGRWQGLPISPGRVRGRVRVVRDIRDGASLQDGEILVARSAEPALTPLFLRAAGVVLELGSVLSHGAIVAREYGLPAVVNVAGATERLRDGDEITVDADAGWVVVHRAPMIPAGSAQSVFQGSVDA